LGRKKLVGRGRKEDKLTKFGPDLLRCPAKNWSYRPKGKLSKEGKPKEERIECIRG